MKNILLLSFSVVFCVCTNAQSKRITGTILPPQKGGTIFLPDTIKNVTRDVIKQPDNIVLPGKSIKPAKGGSVLLPNANSRINDNFGQYPEAIPFENAKFDGKTESVVLSPTPDTRSVKVIATEVGKKTVKTQDDIKKENAEAITAANDKKQGFGNLLSSPYTSFKETVDTSGSTSDEVPSLLTAVVKKFEQPKNPRIVETLDPGVVNNLPNKKPTTLDVTGAGKSGFKMPELESIDPSLLPSSNSNKTNVTTANSKGAVMPELAAIDGGATATAKTTAMPELASLGEAGVKPQQSSMPELAAIEGGETKSTSGMPELASIEEEKKQETKSTDNQTQTPKVKTDLKGMIMPKGTVLTAKDRLSYVFKPAQTKDFIDSARMAEEKEQMAYKPSAGGAFVMPQLSEIEIAQSQAGTNMPELAPIEGVTNTPQQEFMPALALIETQQISLQNYPQQQQQRQVAAKPISQNVQSPCPCPPKKKKYYPKKKVYSYRMPAPQQPATVIRYVNQPSQTIVYVPVQQQQAAPKPQAVYQEPVKQQPKERVVYTDYTNTYKKQDSYNRTCNCGTGTQQSSGGSLFKKNEDPAAYYDPNKYVGVSAGPTSGDYPVTAGSSGSPTAMRYTFYVNNRGKYSVNVYNNLISVLLQQDGKIIESKVNAVQDANNAPKLNYFGSVENLAGVPIEYNYNRSVHKIGNLEFAYDFEGFIKSVNGSSVLYNSASNLSQVDNVRIHYEGIYVKSVDPNNGIVYFNPNEATPAATNRY